MQDGGIHLPPGLDYKSVLTYRVCGPASYYHIKRDYRPKVMLPASMNTGFCRDEIRAMYLEVLRWLEWIGWDGGSRNRPAPPPGGRTGGKSEIIRCG